MSAQGFTPTPEALARGMREYGFDARHLYALTAVVAAWRADGLPITAAVVDGAVSRERGVGWGGQCLVWLERRGYVRRAGKGGNGNAIMYTPTTLGLQTCPAPPVELAAE
jgi:hypothetical protein